ncbi:MAG: acetoacetate decarboxylase family protein [Chloroflexota bacterium]
MKPGGPFSNLYGEGHYHAFILTLSLTTESVRALLPGPLELSPQSATTGGAHPVFFMFGHHTDVHSHLFRWPAMNYREFILGVPCVQWKNPALKHRGPFFYMPRLFLDSIPPIVLGWLYGFAKMLARIRLSESDYRVDSLIWNRRLVKGQFKVKGQPESPSHFPLFTAVREMLQQPFVGRTPLGIYRCSNFDWNFGEATIQPVEAEMEIAEAFRPGVPVGRFSAKGIDEAPLGAFRIRTHWKLSVPMKCS